MHYIYKIRCDSEIYVGYTSRPPRLRWEEHLENAAAGGKSKFYKRLRETGITDKTYHEYDSEVEALVAEIQLIAFYTARGCSLNSTKGGEGNNYKVKIKDGQTVIREVSKKTKQARRKWYASKRKRKRSSRRKRR